MANWQGCPDYTYLDTEELPRVALDRAMSDATE